MSNAVSRNGGEPPREPTLRYGKPRLSDWGDLVGLTRDETLFPGGGMLAQAAPFTVPVTPPGGALPGIDVQPIPEVGAEQVPGAGQAPELVAPGDLVPPAGQAPAGEVPAVGGEDVPPAGDIGQPGGDEGAPTGPAGPTAGAPPGGGGELPFTGMAAGVLAAVGAAAAAAGAALRRATRPPPDDGPGGG